MITRLPAATPLAPPDTPEAPEFGDYLAAIKRRGALLLGVSLPILAISAALSLGLPDIYVATGLIKFSDATISGELPTLPAARGKAFVDLYMLGLTGAVLSPPVLNQLLREIPELVTPGKDREDLISDIIERTRVKPVKLRILDPATSHKRDVISTFAVTFDSRDPVIAQKVTAWLTNAFIGGNRVGLQMRARSAREFYAKTAETYGRRITQLEGELAEFKARYFHELPELTRVNLGVLGRTQRDLDDAARQVRALEVERILLEGQLAQAQTASLDRGVLSQLQTEYSRGLATYGPDHPAMLSLRRQIDTLRSSGQSLDTLSTPARLQMTKEQLSQMRQRYSADHPDVQRLQRQVTALESAALESGDARSAPNAPFRSSSGDVDVVRLITEMNALDTRKSSLEQHEAQLRQQLEDLESRIDSSPMIEHQYKTLQDQLAAAHAKYDEVSRNVMALDMTSAAIASGRSDDLILVEAPSLPLQPDKPRRLAIAGVGAALAVLLGFTTVIFREAFDPKIRGRRDIYRLLKVWPLVAIPVLPDARRARRKYWQIGALTACTLIVSAGAVITGSILLK